MLLDTNFKSIISIMEEKLILELEKRSVIKKGHFVLSCGRHSNTFIGITQISSDPTFLNSLALKVVKKFDFVNVDIIAGAALSGILFGGLIALKQNKQFIYAERIENKIVFRRGFEQYIRKGSRILIADDIITTGRTINQMKKAINKRGGLIAGYITIWQREEIKNIEEEIVTLITEKVPSWIAKDCSLCKDGIAITTTSNKHGGIFLETYGKNPTNWPANKKS